MKAADYLIIQCTGTPEGSDFTKSDLIRKHTDPPSLGGYGWNRPGTDYLVLADGGLETVIPEQSPGDTDQWGISEGPEGLNGTARFVSYVGGKTAKILKDKDTRTPEQKATLAAVIHFYTRRFPGIRVLGLNQVPAKKGGADPAFDVAEWCREIGVAEANIFKPDTV